MKEVRKMMMTVLAAMICAPVVAEDEHVETSIATDVVSQYVWRGTDCGSASLQPTLGLGYKGLSLTAWGSIGLAEASDTKELDLTLGYTIGNFNIGITDYWFSAGGDAKGRYFKYDSHATNHVFEANVGYDFGVLSAQWFTNFAGNDGVNDSGDRAYSSYVELSAPFSLATCDWTATAGAVPFATSFYGTSGFAVTNLSLKAAKELKITDSFSVPVFVQLTANPCTQKAYLMAGFTLQP